MENRRAASQADPAASYLAVQAGPIASADLRQPDVSAANRAPRQPRTAALGSIKETDTRLRKTLQDYMTIEPIWFSESSSEVARTTKTKAVAELLDMLSYKRPARSPAEFAFIEKFIKTLDPNIDGYGNLTIDVPMSDGT